MLFECINPFMVEKYNNSWEPTEEYLTIEAGTVWMLDNSQNCIGGENHLESRIDGSWIEICSDTLHKCFKRLN